MPEVGRSPTDTSYSTPLCDGLNIQRYSLQGGPTFGANGLLFITPTLYSASSAILEVDTRAPRCRMPNGRQGYLCQTIHQDTWLSLCRWHTGGRHHMIDFAVCMHGIFPEDLVESNCSTSLEQPAAVLLVPARCCDAKVGPTAHLDSPRMRASFSDATAQDAEGI